MGTEVIGVSRRPDRSGGLSVTNSANNDNILGAIVIELAHGGGNKILHWALRAEECHSESVGGHICWSKFLVTDNQESGPRMYFCFPSVRARQVSSLARHAAPELGVTISSEMWRESRDTSATFVTQLGHVSHEGPFLQSFWCSSKSQSNDPGSVRNCIFERGL